MPTDYTLNKSMIIKDCSLEKLITVISFSALLIFQVNDYKGLFVRKINNAENEITVFSTLSEAKEALFKITEKYNLCQKINGLYKTSNTCFQYQIKECKDAYISKKTAKEYNKKDKLFVYKNMNKTIR